LTANGSLQYFWVNRGSLGFWVSYHLVQAKKIDKQSITTTEKPIDFKDIGLKLATNVLFYSKKFGITFKIIIFAVLKLT
jgi:hypothetical protein